MSCLIGISLLALLSLLVTTEASAQLPFGFQVETVVPDAAIPVSLAPVPDGRVFYAELLTGSIRVLKDGVLQPQPFVTLQAATSFDVAGARGLGLLSVTADPDFSTNRFLYAVYTPTPDEIVVSRFRDDEGIGVDEVEILRQPGDGKHNGGRIVFLPDKTLLMTRGDTGFQDLAQDAEVVQGSIIRVNADGSIPADNPMADSPVYAAGIRNSFGIAVHPITGEAIFSENGRNDDEINLLKAGGNYGWPLCVGNCEPPNAMFIDPIVTFTPSICPTGMDFYSGDTFPEQYRNDLFFTDCNTGRVQRIKLVPPSYDRVGLMEDFVGEGLIGTLDVKTGADGNLYYTTFDAVFRLVPPSGNETVEFAGMVARVDAEGGEEAVAGATVVLKQRIEGVTVFKHKTLTDEIGRYHFTGLQEGEYKVVTKKRGFQKRKTLVQIVLGEPLTDEVTLLDELP
ncbi:MAG TPA: hypothetical protein EYN60_00500 [Nitrospirales bacterium]|nr:hypothetical protein [Nitrospirales bacterium]HIC04441.1 hypothetical protein [Nitrospirales bacterium]HIO69001.1 hypothetical protein [Nitrospirales bacterium]